MASFSRVSSVLCFGVTWSVRAPSGKPLLRDVTGKALLCSRCSVVLRHWHGPRLHKWLVSKVRVQRTGARWRAQLRGVSEMFKPCSRESERQKRREEKSERAARASFKTVQLGPARGRLVESDCPYGAEPPPPHVQAFWGWNLRGPTFQSFRGRYKLTDFICLFSHT